MKILKTFFGRRLDGVWEIQNMASVPLEPEPGAKDPDFYRVHDDFFGVRPNILGTIRSVMAHSIVPVVAHVPGESVLRCLGTGFFVSCTGLMITAGHIVSGVLEQFYGQVMEIDNRNWNLGDIKFGVMVQLNHVMTGKRAYIFRDIEWGCFLGDHADNPLPIKGLDLRLTSDVAICKVSPITDKVPYQPLSIIQHGIKGVGIQVEKPVAAVGYGEMAHIELEAVNDRIVAGDFPFALHVSKGTILERFPDNGMRREVSTPGACFSATTKLPAGMSGSPIFDAERIYVHGVVSKGWEGVEGLASLGYGSMLAPALTIPIKPMGGATLLDLLATSDHGMSKIRIPDA